MPADDVACCAPSWSLWGAEVWLYCHFLDFALIQLSMTIYGYPAQNHVAINEKQNTYITLPLWMWVGFYLSPWLLRTLKSYDNRQATSLARVRITTLSCTIRSTYIDMHAWETEHLYHTDVAWSFISLPLDCYAPSLKRQYNYIIIWTVWSCGDQKKFGFQLTNPVMTACRCMYARTNYR